MMKAVLIALLYSAQLANSKPVGLSNSESYITATKGERFILPCGITQAQNCQWMKDGFGLGTQQALPGWPRYSLGEECDLLIDPVLPIDEGTYQCQGGGKMGENVVVTVVAQPGPPHIDQAKDGDVIEVVEDEEVTLNCESKGGRPEADVQWNYGNIKLLDIRKKVVRMEDLHTDLGPQEKQLSDHERKTFKTISTLRFTAKEDVTITCSAFNEDFPTLRTSRPFHVKVKHRPKIEMKFSQEKMVEGDNLEVECLVKAYPEDVTYKWFVDDVEEDGFKGNKFEMKKLTRMHHKSNIKCLVENQVGKAEVVKSLNVEFGPKMLIQPSTVNAKAGDTVTFTCKALANPEPTYVWVKGTSSSSPEVVGTGKHLSVVASDETETDYICKVHSPGFPIITASPAQLIIDKDVDILEEIRPRVIEDVEEDIEDSDPTEAPMLPIIAESKASKDTFTKVLKSFKKDYLLFQKRTDKYMKQSDNYFIDSNKFEKKYKVFKKKIRKFPKSLRRFLKNADLV